MPNQGGSDWLPRARDDVHDPIGEELRCGAREHERRQGRLLRGLEDTRVTRREGGSELPNGHHQWVVPGGDEAGHAYGLTAERRGIPPEVLAARPSVEAPTRAREEAKVVDCIVNLVAGHIPGFADVAGFDSGELIGVRCEPIGKRVQCVATLSRSRRRPMIKGRERGRDCSVNVLHGGIRNFGEAVSARWVDDGAQGALRLRPGDHGIAIERATREIIVRDHGPSSPQRDARTLEGTVAHAAGGTRDLIVSARDVRRLMGLPLSRTPTGRDQAPRKTTRTNPCSDSV